MSTRNPWKGAVVGVLGGAAGLLAMRLYWQYAAPRVNKLGGQDQDGDGGEHSISLVGQQHKKDESSTAALGRLAYHALSGKDPQSDETKTLLSYLVHWGYGLLQGGVYGALRGGVGAPDLAGGALFGAGLWLFGDELMAPLLGLQAGPGASPPLGHVNRLGAHLSYGLGTALVTQLLDEML